MTARLIADGLNFPECARWSDGEIWFVDTPSVKVATSQGHVRHHARIPSRLVLGLAFTAAGNVLVGDAVGRRIYAISDDGSAELYADLSDHFAYLGNELAVAGDQSIYVGSVGFDLLNRAEPMSSRLARVTPDGGVAATGPPVVSPNGLALSDDGRTLFVAESFASKVTAIAVRDDHTLGEATTFADLAGSSMHRPDGIGLDPRGGLWYADPAGGALVHLADDGSEVTRVTVPLAHPTSCWVDGDRIAVTATSAMVGPDLRFDGAGALFIVQRPS